MTDHQDLNKLTTIPEVLSQLPLSVPADLNVIPTTIQLKFRATMLPPLTTRETAVEAMKFCFLWFIADYFGNAALQYTNVPSFTIISSISGFFTLFIGVSVSVEKFTWVKFGALVISYALWLLWI